MPARASIDGPTMTAATATKYQTLRSRAGVGEIELHMRWVESGMEWVEWIDHTLAEMDAIERSLREADCGRFATSAEVDDAFNRAATAAARKAPGG